MAQRKKKQRRTAIVPRVVFQTVVAMSVVPAAAVALSGCGGIGPAADSGFGVADVGPRDAGTDTGMFSVAMPIDSGVDGGMFGVADVGPPPDAGTDTGMFSVAMPIDSGFFSVAVPTEDAG